MIRVLTQEELDVLREWADRVLRDTHGAEILTEEVLNGTVSLLHKGGDTNDRPSDWRPIVLLNTCMQLVYHVINCRLTEITEKENLIAPGQAGGRQGRGVDVNQAKMDWLTQEAHRLQQRFFRIDIDFKNAFNSSCQAIIRSLFLGIALYVLVCRRDTVFSYRSLSCDARRIFQAQFVALRSRFRIPISSNAFTH